jgi:hypothetical protein
MYEAYAAEHMLPLARIELQLARMVMLLDGMCPPGLIRDVKRYLIAQKPEEKVPPPPSEATEQEADAIAAALGF